MRWVKIRKRSGGTRLVVVPTGGRKRACLALLVPLQNEAMRLCDPNVVHGFMPWRSPVTNASRHIGCAFTVSFDLKDFFDSVVIAKVPHLGISPAFVKHPVIGRRVAAQGLPTSPTVANIAAVKLDTSILAALRDQDQSAVYTRYADDLTFSCDRHTTVDWLLDEIPELVQKQRFAVNPKKTYVQLSSAGRRIITGVAVGDTDLVVPRRIRRKLRAARHQRNLSSARGLEEWSKLKPPSLARRRLNRVIAATQPADQLQASVDHRCGKWAPAAPRELQMNGGTS